MKIKESSYATNEIRDNTVREEWRARMTCKIERRVAAWRMMENENLFDRQLEQKGFERNNDTLIHPRDSSLIIQYVLFDFPIDESLSFIVYNLFWWVTVRF